jgi:hypothetical protein
MADFAGYYISTSLVERRLSKAVVRRVYDDNNLGVVIPDEYSPVVLLVRDSESMFEGYCRGIYDLNALRAAKPPEAVRLCLDCSEYLAAKRFPRAVNRSWVELEKSVRDELMNLRKGLTRFDVIGTPEPAANQGGYVSSGDVNSPEVRPMTFGGGWGSF